jgi:hypothetical protein
MEVSEWYLVKSVNYEVPDYLILSNLLLLPRILLTTSFLKHLDLRLPLG